MSQPTNNLAIESVAWIGRAAILGLLLVAPWPYGMANWQTQQWLWIPVLLAFAAAMIVAVVRRISPLNPLTIGLGVVLLLAMTQCVLIPEGLWQSISAAASFEAQVDATAAEFDAALAENANSNSATPASTDGDSPLAPRTISVHPLQTQASVSVFALAAMTLVAASVLFRNLISIVPLLLILAAVGFCEAWLGLYQAVAAGDWRILNGLRTSSFGTFVSRNSAPQYLASALGSALALAVIYRKVVVATQADKRYQIKYPSVNPIARIRRRIEEFVGEIDLVSAILLVVMISLLAGILVSNSRGGILACVAAGIIVIACYAFGKANSLAGSIAILLLLACVGGFLSMFELDEVIGNRLGTLSEEAYKLSNARFDLWKMALGQPSTWMLGSGLGAFHFAVLPAYDQPRTYWFYHAENIYIELLSAVGPVGLVAVLIGIVWLLRRLLTRSEASSVGQALRLATLYTVVAIGLHSLVDFSIILPGVFLPAAALLGAYLGAGELPSDKKQNRRKRQSHRRTNSNHRSRTSASRHRATGATPHSRKSVEPVGQDPPEQIDNTHEANPNDQRHWDGQRTTRQKSAARSMSSNQAAGDEAAVESQRSVVLPVVAASLLVIPVFWGLPSLREFARAEQIGKQLAAAKQDATEQADAAKRSGNPASREALQIESLVVPTGSFPEVALERGRIVQEQLRQRVLTRTKWSDGLTERMQSSMSRPEFLSAAVQASDESLLAPARDLLPSGIDTVLGVSTGDFQTAASACTMDWRANWGIVRSDVGQFSGVERSRNYARLLQSARARIRVLEAAANQALMLGHPAGERMLAEVLRDNPAAQSRVAAMLGEFLSIEQLLTAFPTDPLARITLAQRLVSRKLPADAQAVLDSVPLREAFASKNGVRQWTAIAWAAEQKDEIDTQIDALKEASLDAPTDDKLNYRLAQLLLEQDRRSEALSEIQRALDLDRRNPTYRDLRDTITNSP